MDTVFHCCCCFSYRTLWLGSAFSSRTVRKKNSHCWWEKCDLCLTKSACIFFSGRFQVVLSLCHDRWLLTGESLSFFLKSSFSFNIIQLSKFFARGNISEFWMYYWHGILPLVFIFCAMTTYCFVVEMTRF